MSAKPALSRAVLLAVTALGLGAVQPRLAAAPPVAKAPLPTVLLFPATSGDVAALVDLRTRLRLDAHVQVLTYDPESAPIERASAEDGHPEWLTSAPATDEGRMLLARALGANFYAVVSPGRAVDSTHVELVETAPAARTFDWTGSNRQFGVRAMESQVADSVAHPAAYDTPATGTAAPVPAPANPLSSPVAVANLPDPVPINPVVPIVPTAPVAAVPVAAVPVPAAVPLPPVVAAAVPLVIVPPTPAVPAAVVPATRAPVPVVVAAVPPAAPIRIILPKAIPPAPLPLVKSAPLPLELPVQVAQAAPVQYTPPPVPAAVPPPVAPPALAAVPSSPMAAKPLLKMSPSVPTLRTDPLPFPVPVAPKAAAVPPPQVVTPPFVAAPAAVTPQKPVQIATLPKREIPLPQSALPTPFVTRTPPQIAPSHPANPTAPVAVKKQEAKAEDMTAIEPLLAKGDSALSGGDAVSAIALYRQAINGAPLSVVPRLKLAQAYQKDGLNDRALDEARRALEIAPDNAPVQQFLTDLDQQTGTTAGTLVRDRAAIERSPASPQAHSALADALWNNGDLGGAEAEYKAASALAPEGSHLADAQLAQLYAAEARYGDCLAILQAGGKSSYAVAIQIVKNRADTLSSTLSTSRDTFAAKKSTREQFYDDAKKLSAEAQALASFVAQISPPAEYKLSHLHRVLSTNLLAQESATLVSYIETGDSSQNDSISLLEHDAATEMLTAQATEEKLGLWKQKQQSAQ